MVKAERMEDHGYRTAAVQLGGDMTITTCDKCGKQINGLEIKKLTVVINQAIGGIDADLCTNCVADLRDWLRKPTNKKDEG